MILLALTRALALALLVGAGAALIGPSGAPIAAAAQPNPPAKKGLAPPMVLIVVQENYAKPLRPIKDATLCSAQLAGQFRRVGHRVVLIADAPLDEAATDALNGEKAPKGPPVVVREAKTAAAIDKEVGAWMDEVAKADPTFALVVMTGHGVEREKDPFFLSIGDEPDKGGVPFARLVRDASKKNNNKGLYLTMIYDACRTPPPPVLNVVGGNGKPVAPPAKAEPEEPAPDTRGNYDYLTSRERGLDVYPTNPADRAAPDALVPTVLYSTCSGERAAADKGLTYHLTEALRDQKTFDEFQKLMAPDQKGKAELRFYNWCHFATSRLQAQNLVQAPRIVLGDVPLAQVVANRVGAAVPGREARIDLLAMPIVKDMGDFTVAHDRRTGVTITRPNGIQSPWAGGLLPSGSVDPTGRALVLDVVADVPNKMNLKMSFNAWDRAQKPYVNLVNGSLEGFDSAPQSIPNGKPVRITLPLASVAGGKARTLDAVGWASSVPTTTLRDWPVGATLTVFNMSLVSQAQLPAGTKPVESVPDAGDLLTDVWRGGGTFRGDGLLGTELPKGGPPANPRQFLLVPQDKFAGMSRKGGDISPARYAPLGTALQLDAFVVGKQAQVVVDLMYIDPTNEKPTAYIDRVAVALKPGAPKPAPIPLSGPGFVNYLRFSTKDAGVHINSAKLVAK